MMPVFDKEWTLFLDRDGVINRRPINDYVKNTGEFDFLPGVVEAIRLLAQHFGRIIVVTNQQGVGLGLMSQQSLEHIHNQMIADIAEAKGKIDLVLVCPDRKDIANNCRKPSPQMAYKALEAFPEIRFEKSVMAGDTESDMEFGRNVGMKTVQIGFEVFENKPDMHFNSLFQFAKFCTKQ